MVAEWVDAWAPAVLDALAETEQPETLLLDSTDFWWTNSSTRTRRREFAILVAYGYTGPGKGRVWGILASPTARATDYEQLLRDLRLPGPPASIVTDDNLSVSPAVAKLWPPVPGQSLERPFVYRASTTSGWAPGKPSRSTKPMLRRATGRAASALRSSGPRAGKSSTTPHCASARPGGGSE